MDEDKVLAVLTRLEQGQGGLLAAVGELGTDLTELRTDVTELRTNVTELRTDVNGLKMDVTELRANQQSFRTELSDLRKEQTGLRVAMMERFERVESRLSALSDDVTTNMGAVMHALTRQDNDREEVRALTTMVHQM